MNTKIFLGIVAVLAGLLFMPKAHAAPPAGFQNNLLIGSGLNFPTGLGVAPDGRIFILEQSGDIKIYKNGQLLPRVFDQLPASGTGDRGLLGVAFDPNFDSNHYVYFYYIGQDLFHKIVRYNAAGDVGTDGPVEIYNSGYVANMNHAGGTVEFGPDGKLYASLGDSGHGENAQDLSNPLGKIIRINKDGTIPNDNPFYGQAGKDGRVWAYGLRNPFRFQFDSATGFMYEGDVGEGSWEEINRIEKGKNYGWPLCEGVCSNSQYVDPLYVYFHNGGQSYSVTGGPVYRGSMFPAAYAGKLFFADYPKSFIKTLQLDQAGNVSGVSDFDLSAGTVVDMKVGNDGALYYVNIFPGELRQVVFDNGNQYPTARAAADVVAGQPPLTVNFSSAGSSDPEGQQLSYLWDFGDGTTNTSPNPAKVFSNKGVYTVQLTVSDGVHSSLATPLSVAVGNPPVVSLSSPNNGVLYRAGDTIQYSASAVDSQGNNVPDSAFTTEVLFHHGTHVHPFIRPFQSRAGSFAIPTTGESAADVWYELIVTAKDSSGLTGSKIINFYPKKVTLTIQTSPANLKVNVDGTPVVTPVTFESVVGFEHEVDAPVQNVNGQYYEFASWSDGKVKRHVVRAPDTSTTYTATFSPAQAFVGEYYNNIGLTGSPTFTRQDYVIDFSWDAGSPGPGISSDNFSVRWKKRQHFNFGRYTFTVSTDDGARVYVDNQLIIDKWFNHGETAYSATVDLSDSDHDIVIEYYEANGGAVARFSWDTPLNQPAPPVTYPDFKGEYFDNKNLSGSPKLVRNDQQINFVWNNGSPDPVIPADFFSARWTRQVNFAQGTYRFTVTAGDGVRLYIDNQLVVDQWKDQVTTTYTYDKFLNAGNHDVRMEYYDNTGGAVAKLSYAKISDIAPGSFTAKFWNTPSTGSSPAFPITTPDLTRTDAAIQFVWDGGSPDPVIASDHFMAQWLGQQNFNAGAYRFTAASDDGVRVYVDNQLVINQWSDHGLTTYTADVQLTAGVHQLRVEYYENTGGAIVKFSYAPIPTLPSPFTAQYFNNAFLAGTPVLTRNEQNISYNWDAGSPDPAVPADNFSARWQSSRQFATGNYTFTVTADDGVRLYVDNQLVIDQWRDQASTSYSATLTLSSGMHDIRMEYYEAYGGAVASLAIQ